MTQEIEVCNITTTGAPAPFDLDDHDDGNDDDGDYDDDHDSDRDRNLQYLFLEDGCHLVDVLSRHMRAVRNRVPENMNNIF